MAQTLKTPKFQNPGEEALWWEKNQATVEKLFTEAAANGTLRRGTLAAQGKTPTTTIRLAPEDIELAERQAAERGLRYQTYLKMIIHRALRQETAGNG
jgi:predicted DNA binding CopG/RHH family protein